MIRMGRSSKTEQSNEQHNTPTTPISQPPRNAYQTGSIAPQGQALTESETMARDIKEGRLSGFVGNGTVLTGDTNFQAMLRIDGHLTGSVTSKDGTLIIGSTGQVDANIKVAAAVINGTVNGDIVATGRLELGRTARVAGNIQTPRLVIEDGAILEGSCSMLQAQENLEKRKAEAEKQKANEYASKIPETVLPKKNENEEIKLKEKVAEAAKVN
jgi:cytoskeletal protein CcmA (bactofilin family)